MDEPMVTIPLHEYNRLRDESTCTRYVIDQLQILRENIHDLQGRIFDLEEKRRVHQ